MVHGTKSVANLPNLLGTTCLQGWAIAIWIFLSSAALNAEPRKVSILFAADMPIIGHQSGTYAQLASAVSQHRQQHEHSLFLFGGNSLGPSPFSAFDNGSHIIDLLNSIEPDVMSVTKREYSYYEEQLSLRAFEAAFPLIASNVVVTETQTVQDGLVESILIESNGVKFGILAVVDPRAKQQYLLQRVEVKNIANTIFYQSKQFRQQGVDVIIVLHGTEFPEVDNLLKHGNIDISLVKDPFAPESSIKAAQLIDNKVLINEAGDIAIIDVSVTEQGRTEITWQRKSLSNYPHQPQVSEQENNYVRRLERLMDLPIAKIVQDFSTFRNDVRTQENPFGNLIADTLIEFTSADIAIFNSGGIRGDRAYQAGDEFTRKNLFDELPFQANVVLLELSGELIQKTLEDSLSEVELRRGKFPQVANLQITYDSFEPPGTRIKQIQVGDEPLDPDKTYTLATTAYLYGGGDGYKYLSQARQLPTAFGEDIILSDLVLNVLLREGEIDIQKEGRIQNLRAWPAQAEEPQP